MGCIFHQATQCLDIPAEGISIERDGTTPRSYLSGAQTATCTRGPRNKILRTIGSTLDHSTVTAVCRMELELLQRCSSNGWTTFFAAMRHITCLHTQASKEV